MQTIKQISQHNLNIISVQKFKKVFLLFTNKGIYVFGERKEVEKFMRRQING